MGDSLSISTRHVLRERLFWLNLAVVLVATSWIPLVSMDVTGADGEVTRHAVAVYRCYQALFTEPSAIAIAAIVVHLTVCFAISLFFRKWALRAREEA